MPSADVYWKKERNIKSSDRLESARARFLWGSVGLEPTYGSGRNRWLPTWDVGDDSVIGVHTLLAVWADPHGPTSPNSVMLPWCAMPRHAALPRGPSALGSPSSRWRMPTAHALLAPATETHATFSPHVTAVAFRADQGFSALGMA